MLETAYKILTDFFIRSQIIRLFFMLSILSRAGFVFGRWGLMRKNEHRDLLHITLCAQLLLIHITCWLHFNVLSFQIFLGLGACVNMLSRGLLLCFEADSTFLRKDQKVVLTPCGRGGRGGVVVQIKCST